MLRPSIFSSAHIFLAGGVKHQQPCSVLCRPRLLPRVLSEGWNIRHAYFTWHLQYQSSETLLQPWCPPTCVCTHRRRRVAARSEAAAVCKLEACLLLGFKQLSCRVCRAHCLNEDTGISENKITCVEIWLFFSFHDS